MSWRACTLQNWANDPSGVLVSPDALAGREHGIAAVAFLIVPVILVAVDDNLVAHLPTADLVADRPDDAGRIGAGNVILGAVHLERGDRLPEGGPDPVVVDPGGHDQDQHLLAVDPRNPDLLLLHGSGRLPQPVGPDHPCLHPFRHVAKGRDFPDFVDALDLGARVPRRIRSGRCNSVHSGSRER